jgi:hypothetical protein
VLRPDPIRGVPRATHTALRESTCQENTTRC